MNNCETCEWFKTLAEQNYWYVTDHEIEEAILKLKHKLHHPAIQYTLGDRIQELVNNMFNMTETQIQEDEKTYPNFGECESPKIVSFLGKKPKKSELVLLDNDDGFNCITLRVRKDFDCVAWEEGAKIDDLDKGK